MCSVSALGPTGQDDVKPSLMLRLDHPCLNAEQIAHAPVGIRFVTQHDLGRSLSEHVNAGELFQLTNVRLDVQLTLRQSLISSSPSSQQKEQMRAEA